jgi:hypothetical protein
VGPVKPSRARSAASRPFMAALPGCSGFDRALAQKDIVAHQLPKRAAALPVVLE